MKKTAKLLSVFFAMMLCIASMCSIASFAEDKAPVSITVKSDKETYSKGDTMKFNVSVSNNNPFAIDLVSLEASLPEKYEITENGKAELKIPANETQKYTISAKSTDPADAKGTDSPKTGVYPPVLFILIGGAAVVIAFKSKKSRKMFSLVITAFLLSSVAVQGFGSYTNAAESANAITSKAEFKYNNAAVTLTLKTKIDSCFITVAEDGKITVCPLAVDTDALEVREDGKTYKTTEDFSGISGHLGFAKDKSVTLICDVLDRNGDVVKSTEVTPDADWKVEDAGLAEGYNKVIITAITDDNRYEKELEIFVPQTLSYDDQALTDVTGVSNARQLGGYINSEGRAVKQDVLLRTAKLSNITDDGIKALQEKYNVSDIMDFRYERELNPKTSDKEIEGINHHIIPLAPTKESAKKIFANDPDLFAEYQEIQKNASKPGGFVKQSIFAAEHGLVNAKDFNAYFETDEAASYYREAFDIFLNKPEDAAILFHCAGGKDRTGVVSMLLLSALDVDKDVIMQDYLMTNVANASKIEELKAAAEDYTDDADLQYNIVYNSAVYPELMEETITHFTEQYGSVKGFLREKVGLTDEDFAKLKELYLEK